MSVHFSQEVLEIIECGLKISEISGLRIFTSVALFKSLSQNSKLGNCIIRACECSFNEFQELIDDELYELFIQQNISDEEITKLKATVSENDVEVHLITQECSDIIDYAFLIAEENEEVELSVDDLLFSFFENAGERIKNVFRNANCDFEEVRRNFQKVALTTTTDEFTLPPTITPFVTVINSKFGNNPDCAIRGREAELNTIWQTLMKKTKRNLILIGEPGVGKTSIIYKLTCDIINHKCPKEFENFLVLCLDVNALIAGTTCRGQAEERYQDLIDFLEENKNVILFIDEIHMIIGAGTCSRDDSQDFANVLKPILAGDDCRIIGATTEEEYHRYFSRDGALRRRFHLVQVDEPKTSEVYEMLKDSIKQLEMFHGVTISKKMVDFIILNSSCFNYQTKNPDRTKDLIDLSMATAKKDGKKAVDRASVMKNFDVNIKKFKSMSEHVIKSTAYHEAGHYVMWRMSNKLVDEEVVAVSIMPAQNYMGVNVLDRTEQYAENDLSYFIDQIAVYLAGQAAEKLYTNTYSAGASLDLEQASKIAYNVVAKYGMSAEFGRYRIYLGEHVCQMRSEKIVDSIDAEIKKILDRANKRAEEVLGKNRKLLEAIVEQLCKKGIMSKKDLDSVVAKFEKEGVKV